MVFTTAVNYIRARGPDEFWRKRKIFKLAAHFVGRPRNVYSLSIRSVQRALAFATKGRKLLKEDMRNLWTTRIIAGCHQHNIDHHTFKESLQRSDILLNRKTLAILAAWEPHSFKALTDIAKRRAVDDGINEFISEEGLDTIITRGTLYKK